MVLIGTDRYDRIIKGDDPEEKKRLRREQRALEAGIAQGIGNPPISARRPSAPTATISPGYLRKYEYLERLIDEARSRAESVPPTRETSTDELRRDLYDSSSIRSEQERIARLLFSKTKLFQGKDFETEYSNRDEFRKWLDTALVGGPRYFASQDDYRTFNILLKEYDKLEKAAKNLAEASKEEETRRSYLDKLYLAAEPPPVPSPNAPDIISDLKDDYTVTVIPKDIFHVEGPLVGWKPNIRDLFAQVPANDYRKADGFSVWGQDTSALVSVAQARYGTEVAYWLATLSEAFKVSPKEVKDPISGRTVRYNDVSFPEWGATVVLDRLGYSPGSPEYNQLRDTLIQVYESVMLSEISGLKAKTGGTGVISDEIGKLESKLPFHGLYLVSGFVRSIETLDREIVALFHKYMPGLSPEERREKLRELTLITGDPLLLKSSKQRLADVAYDGALLAMTILAPYAGKGASALAAPIAKPIVRTAVTYLGFQAANTLPDVAAALYYADAYGLSTEEKIKLLGTTAAADILGSHFQAPARPAGLGSKVLGAAIASGSGAALLPVFTGGEVSPVEGAALGAGSAAAYILMKRVAQGVYGYTPAMGFVEGFKGTQSSGRMMVLEGVRDIDIEPQVASVVRSRFLELVPDGNLSSDRGAVFRSLVWAAGLDVADLADDKVFVALKRAMKNAEERGIISPEGTGGLASSVYSGSLNGPVQLAYMVLANDKRVPGRGIWVEADELLKTADDTLSPDVRAELEHVREVFGKVKVRSENELIPAVSVSDLYRARGISIQGSAEPPEGVNPRYWVGAEELNVVDDYWNKSWARGLSKSDEAVSSPRVAETVEIEEEIVGPEAEVPAEPPEPPPAKPSRAAGGGRPRGSKKVVRRGMYDTDINGNPVEGPVHVRYNYHAEAKQAAMAYLEKTRQAILQRLRAGAAVSVPLWFKKNVKNIIWSNIDVGTVRELYNSVLHAKDLVAEAREYYGKSLTDKLTKSEIERFLSKRYGAEGRALVRSYDALRREVDALYDFLVSKEGVGLNVVHIKGVPNIDPYKSFQDMLVDIRERGRLFVGNYQWWSKHPMLRSGTLRKLQAIRDFYGHNLMGADYSVIGHENAWNFLRHLFSEDAQQALAIELRGRPAWFFEHGGMTVWENPAKIQVYEPKLHFLDRKFWDENVSQVADSALALAVTKKPRSRVVAPSVDIESTAAGVMQVGGMPPKPPSKAPPRGEPGHGFERYEGSYRKDGLDIARAEMDNRLAYSNEYIADKHFVGRLIAQFPVLGKLARAINPALDFSKPHEKAVLSGVLAHANYMRESALATAQLTSGIMKTLQPVLGVPLRYTLAAKGSVIAIPAIEVLIGYSLSEATGNDIYRDLGIVLGAGSSGFASEAAKKYQWRFSNLSRIPVAESAPDVVKQSKGGARFALIIEDVLRNEGKPRWFALTPEQLNAVNGYIAVLNGLIEDANTWRVAANMKPIPKADVSYAVFVKPSDRSKILKIGGGAAGIRGKILSPRNVSSPDFFITNERVIRGYSSVKDFLEKNPDVRLMEPHEMIVSQLLEIANAKAQALFAHSIQSVPGYSMVWVTKPELKAMLNSPDVEVQRIAAMIEDAQEKALQVGQWETLPYIQGVRFKSDLVDAASKLLSEDEIGALRLFDSIALNLRNTLFTIDGSAWTMQGFMAAVTDPISTLMGMRDLMLTSLLGEKHFFKVVASRPKLWEIANKAGLVTGREFGGKELEHFILGKIPIIGGVESRGFGAFLPMIRLMQFEALYDYERIARSLGLGSMPARTAFEVMKTLPAAAPILAATDIIHLSDDQKENIALTAGFAAAIGITSRLGARVLANKLAAHESKNAIKAAVTAAKVVNRSTGVFNWEGSGITARQLAIERTIFARSPALVRNTIAMFQRALTDIGPEGLYARMYLVRTGIMSALALAGLKYAFSGQLDSFDPDDPSSIFSPESFMKADLGELGRVTLSNPFLSLARALFYAERPDNVTRWRYEDWRPWIGVTDWYTARMSDLAAITSLPVQISRAARYLSTRAGAPAYSEPLGVSHYAILPVSMQPLFETGFVQEKSELAEKISKGLAVLGLEENPSYNRPNEVVMALASAFIGINHSPETLGAEVKRIRLDAMEQVLGGQLKDRNNDGIIGWEDLNNEQKRSVRAYLETNRYYNQLIEKLAELEAQREQAGLEPSMVSKYFDERDRILEWAESSIQSLYNAYRSGQISLAEYREYKSRVLQERSLRLDALQEAFSRISAGRRGTNESVIDYISRWEQPEDRAVSTYYAMIDMFTDKVTGEIDWDGLEKARQEFLGTLPADVREYVERNTVRKEYSPADRLIAEGENYVRQYFDSLDSVWDSFKPYSQIMSRFSSRDEFEKWLSQEAAAAGMRPEDMLSQIILKADKVLGLYYDFVEGLSQWMRFNDPMLDAYLTELYGFAPINPITRAIRMASGLYRLSQGKSLSEDVGVSDSIELLRRTLYGDMPDWFMELMQKLVQRDVKNRVRRTYRSKFRKFGKAYEMFTPAQYSPYK
jgi:hypothetical protein